MYDNRQDHKSKLKKHEFIIKAAYSIGSGKVLVDLHYGTIKGSNLKKISIRSIVEMIISSELRLRREGSE